MRFGVAGIAAVALGTLLVWRNSVTESSVLLVGSVVCPLAATMLGGLGLRKDEEKVAALFALVGGIVLLIGGALVFTR